MKYFCLAAALAIGAAALPVAAIAQSVLDLADVAALEAQHSGATNINIEQYSVVNNITTGGGQFILGASGCTPDEGVILKDDAGNCYYRQFSGPVHLPWYGVSDAADPSCYNNAACDAKTALFNAFAASAQYGDGGVTTDGRSIALLTQCASCISPIPATAEIPKGQYLTCARPPGARHSWDDHDVDAYWRLPGSLVLNPAYTIFRDESTLLSDCFIRPSWLYPQDLTTTPLYLPPRNVADTVRMTHFFTGTATTCNKPNCNMSNVTIAGFDICDDSGGASKAVLSNVVHDCGTNEWVHASGGGGPRLHGITADPLLEGSLSSDKQFLMADIVNVTQQSGTDNVMLRIDTGSPSNQFQPTGDTVLVTGLGLSTPSGSPVSANGRWLTSSVTQESPPNDQYYDIVLVGASWAGPTVTGSAWKAGAPVITVRDSTNIIPGQYICASGTPPLCTPPSDFNFFPGTLGVRISGTGSMPQVSVGSTAHWPVSGLAKIVSTGVGDANEFVLYRVVNATDILLTARGQHGTLGATHSIGDTVTAAAPIVLSVPPPVVAAAPAVLDPVPEAVIVSAPAQNTGSASVTFANDTMLWGTSAYGALYLNPSYHTWTANPGAGGRPSSLVTDKGDHGSGDSAHDIKNFKDCWKAQPGMLVTDLSDPNNTYFPMDAHVDSCTGTTLTMDASIGSGITFSGDLIQLSGCGYPGIGTSSAQPWLGNCAATALLLGGTGARSDGTTEDDEVQGVLCDTIHTNSSEIAIHSLNAPATGCTNFIADESGGNGPQADADSAALWLDGPATKSQYSNGRLGGGANAILDTPGAGQVDGIGISNVQVGGNIALGANAKVTLIAPHGQTGSPAPTLFDSSGVILAQILGANLSQWSVVSDDPAALAALSCSGNIFATAPCAQVKGTPTCGTGCTSVSGNDSNFDVKPASAPAPTVSVLLAGVYASAPVCTISPGTTSTGTIVTASISAVDWKPWGTTLTFKANGPATDVYGSCRGATG